MNADAELTIPREVLNRIDEVVRELLEDAGIVAEVWALVATEHGQVVDRVVVVRSPRPYTPSRAELAGMLTLAASTVTRQEPRP